MLRRARFGVQTQSLKQALPGGEAGEWQGGGLGGVEALWWPAAESAVEGHQLRVAALPCHIAGGHDPITPPPAAAGRDGWAKRLDHAAAVKAQHEGRLMPPFVTRPLAGPQLGVDRVDADRLDAHQQVVGPQLRGRQLQIEQGCRIADRQVLTQAYGAHGLLDGLGPRLPPGGSS